MKMIEVSTVHCNKLTWWIQYMDWLQFC